jgi:excisionase family DNA binding protein
MNGIILVTRDELDEIIQSSVKKALSEFSNRQPESSGNLLSITDACKYLNLAKPTLYRFTSQNLIPFIKKSQKLYFRKMDLEAWVMEGKQKTQKEIIEQNKRGR